ncbi:MAG: riboflavin synthase [Chloroflexi bacterium]|nr:riboflavin synthase [Chloroflexota bacterium]
MFTGIIEEIGSVKQTGQTSLAISATKITADVALGNSISVNGACLTVIDIGRSSFSVEIMPETRRLTNIGSLRVGEKVNLERALPAQGRIGGHFVQGHVDDTGKAASLVHEAGAIIASIACSGEVLRYIVKKGFVAINGVSLTVINCDQTQFSVSLVGYTLKNTTMGLLKQGQVVNLEVDIMAKYIEKFYHPNKQEGIINLLNQYDYLRAR